MHFSDFVGHNEKESMINTLVHSAFSCGGLIWHFSSKKSHNKVEKVYERSLNILSNTVFTRKSAYARKNASLELAPPF